MASGDGDDAGDTLSVEYRFSPRKVTHLVEQLSEEQLELVHSIGFGGLLRLPRYDKLDRHFSAWLFTRLAAAPAPAPASMRDGAGVRLPVTARDVHDVGVPHGGRRVGVAATDRDVDAVLLALVPGGLDLDPRKKRLALADAERVLLKLTAPPPPPPSSSTSSSGPAMTPSQRGAFVVAFVVFVVGHFLAPLSQREHTNTDVFHALVNPSPSEVRGYDWAGYVLNQLLECAGPVRKRLKELTAGSYHGKPKIELSGCLLFLQVFYLERLDLERPQPELMPRIAAYDTDTLRGRIDRDRCNLWPEGGLKQFGYLKFKDPQEPPVWPAAPTNASGCSGSSTGPQLAPNSQDPQEKLMSPACNTTGTRGPQFRPNSEFVVNKDTQEKLISPEAPTNASGSTTTRGPRLHVSSESNQHEESDMGEDEEYKIYRSYYLMRKCIKEKKHSSRDQMTPHRSLDEHGKKASYGREHNPTVTTKGLPDSNVCHPNDCGANTDATAVPAANCVDGSGEYFSTGNSPDTGTIASEDCVLQSVQGGLNMEANFIARQPRTTRLAPPYKKIRQPEFHIEEIIRQGSHQNVMQADSPSAGHCQTNSHPSGNVVIDIDPDLPDKRHVATEAEQEASNKRQRVNSDSSQEDANACIRWLKSCREDDHILKWVWIIHNEPTPIEITGESIRSQFICGGSLKQDTCNLIMRLFRELDDKMYSNNEARPRHFLAADWATLALASGSNLITESSPAVRSMFTGPHIAYKVEFCRTVIAPVQWLGDWSCYVWHFTKKHLYILDPLMNHNGSSEQIVKGRHKPIMQVLGKALLACISDYSSSMRKCDMEQQKCNYESWSTFFCRGIGGKQRFMEYNSGFYTLHYAREFDGTEVKTVPKIDELRRDLLYELITMASNRGRLPPALAIHQRN
ncbi:hypothetical protein ACP4OV_011493 [Aristida adscensionis]